MCLLVKFSTRLLPKNYLKRSYFVISSSYSSCLQSYNGHYDSQKRFPASHIHKSTFRRSYSLESARNSYSDLFKSVTESDVVSAVKDALVVVHDSSGLPWCSTIILTTLGLRLLITFPIGVYQSYVLARLELVKLEFAGVVDELKKETAVAIRRFGWSQKQARGVYNASLKTQWRLLVERDNCHPLKTTLVIWIQLPMWILLSLAFRCMAYKYGQDPALSEVIAEQLSSEGVGWISNLMLPDPTGILPATVCLSNLAIIELQASTKAKHTRAQRILTNVFRGFAVISFPIALTVPSCMSLYWSTSSILALAQNVALMSPRLRKTFRIPQTPSQLSQPYLNAWQNFKSRWSFRRSASLSHLQSNLIQQGVIKRLDIDTDLPSIFGVSPSTEWRAFSIPNRPGLVLIRNPFTPAGQRYWIARCLRDFTRKPNKRNIDIDEDLKNIDGLWEHCSSNNFSELEKLRWATLGYHHNWDTKLYSEDNKSNFPDDLSLLCRNFALALGYHSFQAQAAIVNFYHPGSTLSGHVDHSEVDLDAPLLSFSFGQSAIFLVGGATLDEEGVPLLLQSGDVLLMSRDARLSYHAVPRILTATTTPWTLPADSSSATSIRNDSDFDVELACAVDSEELWRPFGRFVTRSRINMNVRQVLPSGDTSLH